MVNGLGYGYEWCEFRLAGLSYAGAASEKLKKASKTNDFRFFWPWLPDATADCSAPCGPIRTKFFVVNRLGYGYWPCEFCWAGSRYAGAGTPAATIDGASTAGGRAKISNSVSKGMQDDAREVVRTTFNPFSMLFQMRYVRTRCSDLLYYFLYHLCLYSNIFTDIFTVFRRFHM